MSDIPSCLPDNAPGPDVIYSNLAGPVVQTDGACFSRPQFVAAITDEDDQIIVTSGTNIIDCATVECGPVGLYCYLSVDEPPTGILVFQPLHFPSPVVVIADNISRCYANPAFIKQVFVDYGTVADTGLVSSGSYAIPVARALCGVAHHYDSCNGNDELIVVNGGGDSTILYNGQCWHSPQVVIQSGTDITVIAGTNVTAVASCFDVLCTGTNTAGAAALYTDQQSGATVAVRINGSNVPHFGIATEKIDDGASGLTEGSVGINFANSVVRQTIIRSVLAPGRLEVLVSLLGYKKRLILTRAGTPTIYRLPTASSTVFLDVLAGDTIEVELDDNRPNPSRVNQNIRGFASWKSSPLSLRLYDTAVFAYTGTSAIESLGFTGVGDRIPSAFYTVPSATSTPYPNPDTYVTVQGNGSSEFVLVSSFAPGDQVPHGPANTEIYAGQLLAGPMTFRFYTGRGGAGAHGEMDVYLDSNGTFPAVFAAGPYHALVRQEPLFRRSTRIDDIRREDVKVALPGVSYRLPSIYVSAEGKQVIVSGPPQTTFSQNGTTYNFAGTANGLAYAIV